ncbi:peptidase domain-containing ABC transporter [Chitinophaga polysaccharea]|uniref:peptidase domain-containing ABC transporter n=1 Tax=Chitinophaga TaxID=79328 RepID=UPI0014551D4F|nr:MULTISPECIES: peptidase domain-containing ABC transporter [Chitinophaga]NLR62482.1 peptidase domain-containing ABC transporter [Chitinophaga polysaccharea]NLU92348.1 peptidase domain-containing ABC transporter [Chitinophaga sp. Ak27]
MKLLTGYQRRKFKFISQLDSSDCGPACLAMVCAYYKRKYSVKDIKQVCSVTRMGVSVQDMLKGSRIIGFEANGVKLTPEELAEAPLPLILFWRQSHFVVLYDVAASKNGSIKYFLADPSYGKIQLDKETISKAWMGANNKGIAILLQPSSDNNVEYQPSKRIKVYKEEFIRFIRSFILNNKRQYIFSLLMMIIGLVANWAIPIIFQQTIDKGIVSKSLSIVWALLLAQLALFLGNFVSQIFSDLILTKLNFELSVLLKEKFLHKLMKLPIKYFDTRMNTDTLQRLGDQNKIQTFVTWRGIEIFLSLMNIMAFSIILFNINKYIFCVFFGLSIISVTWVHFFLKIRKVLEYSILLRQTENTNSLYEFIMNMPEIKINNAQHTMISKLSDIQKKLNDLQLRSFFLNIYQNIGVSFFSKLKELIAIAFCAFLIIKGQLTIGALLSISYILGQLAYPVSNLVNYLREAQDADIAQKRINDVYLEKNENEDLTEPIYTTDIKSISVNNVTFKYPGSFSPFVLKDISFSIPRNKITAIVGASGSGKTTLLKLLLSYYAPHTGSILVNDNDLSAIDSEDWRQKCGIVLQDGHIFAGTIAENIAIADADIDRERVMHAAKIACIHEFISDLPMRYNTKVGSVGIQLSGGQKQRLLIARAVYKDPAFLLFDEATSSLDANNEKQIMENLNSFFEGKTVLIIAHRLSTVKNADQIIVLNKGVIVEQGSHDRLVNAKGDYFNLVKNQLELGV